MQMPLATLPLGLIWKMGQESAFSSSNEIWIQVVHGIEIVLLDNETDTERLRDKQKPK